LVLQLNPLTIALEFTAPIVCGAH